MVLLNTRSLEKLCILTVLMIDLHFAAVPIVIFIEFFSANTVAVLSHQKYPSVSTNEDISVNLSTVKN